MCRRFVRTKGWWATCARDSSRTSRSLNSTVRSSVRSVHTHFAFRMGTFVVCFLEWGAGQLKHLPTTLIDAIASLGQPDTPNTGQPRADSAIISSDGRGSGGSATGGRPAGRSSRRSQQSLNPDIDRSFEADLDGGELEDRSRSTGSRDALDPRARRRARRAGCMSADDGGGAGAGADGINGDNRVIGGGDVRYFGVVAEERRSKIRKGDRRSRRLSAGAGAGDSSTGQGVVDGEIIGILVLCV